LLRILSYIHNIQPKGVIHRDIKPSNIIIRKDGGPTSRISIALIDFGSVNNIFRNGETGSTVSGTLGYMSPEQFYSKSYGIPYNVFLTDKKHNTWYYSLGVIK